MKNRTRTFQQIPACNISISSSSLSELSHVDVSVDILDIIVRLPKSPPPNKIFGGPG